MAEGSQNGQNLIFLRVFKRPNRNWNSQLTVWIKDADILPVDQALQALKEAHPGASLSELVSSAIVTAGAKAKREIRKIKRSGL